MVQSSSFLNMWHTVLIIVLICFSSSSIIWALLLSFVRQEAKQHLIRANFTPLLRQILLSTLPDVPVKYEVFHWAGGNGQKIQCKVRVVVHCFTQQYPVFPGPFVEKTPCSFELPLHLCLILLDLSGWLMLRLSLHAPYSALEILVFSPAGQRLLSNEGQGLWSH